ncbi:MAG: hypothetical protein M9894_35370 [Planctomycetes bacterium]|nr:hypothetical protein [Planctomycetota bacterium]
MALRARRADPTDFTFLRRPLAAEVVPEQVALRPRPGGPVLAGVSHVPADVAALDLATGAVRACGRSRSRGLLLGAALRRDGPHAGGLVLPPRLGPAARLAARTR